MTAPLAWAEETQLAPSPTAPARAREFVDRHLEQHDLARLVGDVRLVVSELVTNAVVHARTPVWVRLEELPFCVKLTVYDESVHLPVTRLVDRVSSDDENGRGLWIVDACSSDWGTDLVGDQGKCIWVLFALGPRGAAVVSRPGR